MTRAQAVRRLRHHRHGDRHRARLVPRRCPGADLYVSEKLFAGAPAGRTPLPLPMGPLLADTFTAYDCHVFVISVGAVVRMIAPLLKNKKVDPAVVCVDDAARFAICVLSGHVGRGNAFTDRVAAMLGAQPVVTTASDVLGTLTVDILGRELGWTLDDPDRNVTRGCAAVVNAAPVLFVQETGEPDVLARGQAAARGRRATRRRSTASIRRAFEILLVASDRESRRTPPRALGQRAVVYRPKSLVLGLGCDRGTPPELVERGVDALLAEHGLSRAVGEGAGDRSTRRPTSRRSSRCRARRGWPLAPSRAEELDAVPGIENPSETVKRHVGTRGVAEPAALLARRAPRRCSCPSRSTPSRARAAR